MSVLPFSFTDILKQNYLYLILLFLVLFVTATLKSAWFKGVMGELFVKFLAKLFLSKAKYHAVHDITLPTSCGTTQIDHVYVSRYGVFVVETKNMKGWIYGSEKQSFWTQKMFKKSFRFQNPIMQNYKHVKELADLVCLPVSSIKSVIIFVGEAEFKTKMPASVTKGYGFIRYIKSFKNPILTDKQVNRILRLIEEKRLPPSRKTDRLHVKNLKKRHRR